MPRGSGRCEQTEAQRVLEGLRRQETQVAISKTQHGVPDITTELACGKTMARVASSFSLVISLIVAAQPREWWCRWPQKLHASSVPTATTSLQHLFVTGSAAIIHLSSPVLLLLSLQLAVHFMWPKKHSSTPGIWPLCQGGWCVNAVGNHHNSFKSHGGLGSLLNAGGRRQSPGKAHTSLTSLLNLPLVCEAHSL